MFGRKTMAISKAGRSDTRHVLDAKDTDNNANAAGKTSDDANSEPVEKIDAALIVFGRDDKGKAHASRFGADARAAAMKAAHLMGFVSLAVTKEAMRNIAEGLPEGRVFESGKAFVPFVKEGTCLALEGHAKQFPRDVLELSANQIAELDAQAAKPEADTNKLDDGDTGDGAAQADSSDGAKRESDSNAGQDHNENDVTDGSDAIEPSSDDTHNNTAAKSDALAGAADIEVGTTVLAVDDPDDGWWEAKVTHAHKSGIGTNTITMLTLEWVLYPDEPNFVRRANEVAYFSAAYGQQAPEPNKVGKAA